MVNINKVPTQTHLYIVESFFLILKNKPYEKITIDELARKAGISRATYYRYFSDRENEDENGVTRNDEKTAKKNVVSFYFEIQINELVREYYKMGISQDSTRTIAKLVFDRILSEKERLLLLYRNNLIYNFLEIMTELTSVIFGQVSDYYLARTKIFCGGLFNFALWWLVDNNCQKSVDEMVDLFLKCINLF